jgi:ribosomal protein S14
MSDRLFRPPPGSRSRQGCHSCGQPRGEVRQELVAHLPLRRYGLATPLWLCRDCADSDSAVEEFLAAWRAARRSE